MELSDVSLGRVSNLDLCQRLVWCNRSRSPRTADRLLALRGEPSHRLLGPPGLVCEDRTGVSQPTPPIFGAILGFGRSGDGSSS